MTSSEDKITAEEMMESLTGFDEVAIAKHWAAEVLDLAEHKPTTFTRSLVFVLMRRGGMSDHEAKEAVMNMTLKEVQGHFTEEEEEPVPDDPSTESGKEGLAVA